jgi:ribonuclease BN (tRNA processing enzyme)
MGRKQPIDVFGPKGLKSMTRHVMKAWELDIVNRMNGLDRLSPMGCKVTAHEIKPGLIYEDANIGVTAFRVRHGTVKDAFGFRFETPDKTIVISGDTSPIETLVENSHGCDVLIHESYSRATYDKISRRWQAYRRKYHTSSSELAELATRVKPGLLILYHRANAGGAMALPDPEDVLLDEVRDLYDGNVVTGHDLDVF